MSDALSGTLGGLAGTVQGSVTGLMDKGQGFLDKFFPPEKRGQVIAQFNQFVAEKPKLASFILSQIAVSGIPLGLFICMTCTVALFSIIAALLIALVGALLFIVFCIGVALVIILPTLFFTTAVATFLWLWGMGLYYLYKWFNQDEISNIKEATEKLLSFPSGEEAVAAQEEQEQTSSKPPKLDVKKDDDDEEDENDDNNGKEKKSKPKKLQNGSAAKKQQNGHAKKGDSNNHPDNKYTVADGMGEATGFDANNATDGLKHYAGDAGKHFDGVKGKASGVTDTAGSLKKNVPGGVL